VAGSAESVLEGVEFGMTNGTTTRRCFISQQEIDKWSGHFGAIVRAKTTPNFIEANVGSWHISDHVALSV
jgi:hypothetical protein